MTCSCAFEDCDSTYGIVDPKNPNRKVSFHRFPKDEKKRKLWIKRCNRKDKFNVEKAFICSLHFKEEDYESDMRSKLMNIVPKSRKLKLTALPSRKVNSTPTAESKSFKNTREQRLLLRNRKKTIENIFRDTSNEKREQKNCRNRVLNLKREFHMGNGKIEGSITVILPANLPFQEDSFQTF